MRCDFGQGILLAPPMPMDRFIDLLCQRRNKPPKPPAPAPEMRPGRVA